MELIIVGQPNDLIEVDQMVDNWDGVLVCQYKRKCARLEAERICGRRIENS